MRSTKLTAAGLVALAVLSAPAAQRLPPIGSQVLESSEPISPYRDGRPTAKYRLAAIDQGVVLRHGDGPGKCDYMGARDIWVFESGGTYYMHYDAAGPMGWLAALATSKDLVHWETKGPAL